MFQKIFYVKLFLFSMTKSLFDNELEKNRANIKLNASKVLKKERKEVNSKHVKGIERSIHDFRENLIRFKVDDFDDKSATAQQKYGQRLYLTSSEVLEDFSEIEEITLFSLEEHLSNLKETIQKLDTAFKKYIRPMDKSFENRVKTLNKSFTRILKVYYNFEKFIEKKYKPKANIESSLYDIKKLDDLIENYYKCLDIFYSKEDEYLLKTKRIEELAITLKKLENHEVKQKFEEHALNYQNLQKSFESELSDIRKAIRKHINSITKQKKNKIDVSFMKQIVSDATTTLALQKNTSQVKSLLQEIKIELENRSLGMKRERANSAMELLKEMLAGGIDKRWERITQAFIAKQEAKQALNELNLEQKINRVNQSISGEERDKKRIVEKEQRELQRLKEEINKGIKNLKDNYSIEIDTMLEELRLLE